MSINAQSKEKGGEGHTLGKLNVSPRNQPITGISPCSRSSNKINNNWDVLQWYREDPNLLNKIYNTMPSIE